jgi:hypothetical protein
MTAVEETLERGTEGITRHHKIPQCCNVEGYARGPQDFIGSRRKLEQFLLHKKKKEKWGLEQSNVPRPFVKGTFVVHRF